MTMPAEGAGAPPIQTPANPDVGAVPTDAQAQPVNTEPQAPKEDPDLSRRFAAIARRERALQQREAQAKEQLESVQRFEAARKAARTNPIAFLQEAGLSFQEITDYVLNDNQPSPDAQIKALKEQIEQDKRDREALEAQRREQELNGTVQGFQRQIQSFVDSQGDTYELIRENGAYGTVFEVIEQYWNQNGQMLPVDVAAKHVEDYLEAQARRLLGLKRFAPKEAPPAQTQETMSAPTNAVGANPPPKTLTNDIVPSSGATQNRYLSDDESKREVAKLLRWT